MPASFFPASGTILQLHIYASRCINMHRHTLILRVFAGEGVSAAVYASLTQMTPTALLSANYATQAVLTRLSCLTEEPVWCRRKGFSASSPSLFRHAAEALPQPRKHTERLFRMPPALPDTLIKVMKGRKRSFRRSLLRFYSVKNESCEKRIFMRFHRSPRICGDVSEPAVPSLPTNVRPAA